MRRRKLEITAGAILVAALLYFFVDIKTLWAMAVPVAVHELGHILALRICGMRILGIRAEAKGLCINYSGFCGVGPQIAAALAGPIAGVIYAFAASCFARIYGGDMAELSAGVSLLLSAFNMLPVLPLDGGRIFALAAGRLMGAGRGERLCRKLGLALSSLMLAAGLLLMWKGWGIGLAAAALWLLLAQPEGEGIVKRKEIL